MRRAPYADLRPVHAFMRRVGDLRRKSRREALELPRCGNLGIRDKRFPYAPLLFLFTYMEASQRYCISLYCACVQLSQQRSPRQVRSIVICFAWIDVRELKLVTQAGL
jgi:hypothetical protein